MANESPNPLARITRGWLDVIKRAMELKRESFQKDADLAMKFFECGRELSDHLWKNRERGQETGPDDEEQGFPAPLFRINVGKVAELVQLFGPSMYHRNPSIICEPQIAKIPIELLMQLVPPEFLQQAQAAAEQAGQQFSPESLFPPDPRDAEARVTASLQQFFLNYIQRENNKKKHSRRAIDEALIKGAGIVVTELWEPYDGAKPLVGSFYKTIDDFVFDPDAECLEEAKWIAIRYLPSVTDVAREWDKDEEKLRTKFGKKAVTTDMISRSTDDDWQRKEQLGKSNDLIPVWKVWSKMGIGHKLCDVEGIDEYEEAFDSFGDNCHLVIGEGIKNPLNLSFSDLEDAMTEPDEELASSKADDVFRSVQWPIPFWADGDWPVTMLAYHENPNNAWPMAHIKPALGYLEFITWVMTFMVNRIRVSSQSIFSCAKQLEDDIRQELFSGKDFKMLPIPFNTVPDGDISKAVHFLEIPPMHFDVWKVLEANVSFFEKATGLDDLLYATRGGFRSAKEVDAKMGNSSIRPDDMASLTEDWLSDVARKEAMAAAWLFDGEDVAPIMGSRAAGLWDRFVATDDLEKVAREYTYRVEAGSTRKPNKETRVAQINQALQQWMPLVQWSLQTGNVQIVNAFLRNWCEAMDMEPEPFLLPPPPPPPPNPMQQKVEAELAMKQQELELKKQEMGAKLQFEQAKTAAQIQAEQQKTQAQLQGQQAKTVSDVQKVQAEMAMKAMQARQDMQLGAVEAAADLGMRRQEMQADLARGQLDAGLAVMKASQAKKDAAKKEKRE